MLSREIRLAIAAGKIQPAQPLTVGQLLELADVDEGNENAARVLLERAGEGDDRAAAALVNLRDSGTVEDAQLLRDIDAVLLEAPLEATATDTTTITEVI